MGSRPVEFSDVLQRITPVEGWTFPEECYVLAGLAYGKRVVEIGSFKGRSAVAMAPYAKSLVCVDHFQPLEHAQGFGGESVLAEFEKNVAPWKDKVRVVSSPSGELQPDLFGGGIGLVFIDGNHDYESVKADLRIAAALPRGTVVAMHDYWNPEFPDVAKAAGEVKNMLPILTAFSLQVFVLT